MSAAPEPPPFRTILPDGRRTPRFAGIATFCRAPLLEQVAAAQRPLDWISYGAPHDGGTTYRSGARFGPRAVREASQYIKPHHLERDVNLARRFSIADAGDAPVSPYDCRESLERIATFARALPDPATARLLAVGGDHSIAYANMQATWQRLGAPAGGLAVVHLDAHLDTVDSVWGEKWGHASPFIRAAEDGIIDPARMISLGIRGPLNASTDLDWARAHGVDVVTVDRLDHRDGHLALEAFCNRMDDHPVYVSFDIDALDPAFAPGTGTPVCGGLSTREAFGLLRRLASLTIVGGDVVEVLPDRDPAGITALAAAHVLLEIIALTAR